MLRLRSLKLTESGVSPAQSSRIGYVVQNTCIEYMQQAQQYVFSGAQLACQRVCFWQDCNVSATICSPSVLYGVIPCADRQQ